MAKKWTLELQMKARLTNTQITQEQNPNIPGRLPENSRR